MSLFADIGLDVHDVLSDPDLATANVKIRRVTGSTAGANPWDPPTEVVQIIELKAVVFTASAEYANGTLVVERGDVITASPWATVIEENGLPVNRRVALDVRSSDVVLVDGDERRIISIMRTPAAGNDVSVWSIRVAD